MQYSFYHTPPLFTISWLLSLPGCPHARALCVAGGLFVSGSVLFSGSLYALALTGIAGLGIVAPLGGLAYLLGWLVLIWRGPAALTWQGASAHVAAESSNSSHLLPVR